MTDVSKFYNDVIDDVINGVKDDWVDEGLDLQVLDELKKLWRTKLSDTHVFDPAPVAPSAAQYYNLIQRSQQLRPSGPVNLSNPARQLPPSARVVVSSAAPTTTQTVLPRLAATNNNNNHPITSQMGINFANTGSLGNTGIRTATGMTIQPRLGAHQVMQAGGLSMNTNNNNNNACLGAGGQMLATHAHPASMMGNQQRPGLLPTGIPAGAPMATLPSGLAGHLVQIGQQTYLVPQTLVGLRQPDGSQPQLSLPQLVGAAPGTGVHPSDPTGMFSQTQVDGGHDSDDDSHHRGRAGNSSNAFSGTPASNHLTPGRSSHRTNPDDDDDDDEDDDDFVAATPGGETPSRRISARDSHPSDGPLHRSPGVATGATPNLLSCPPTPMTPPSVMSRASLPGTPGWRRPTNAAIAGSRPNAGMGKGGGGSRTPLGRKRRRSPFLAGDTDTEVEEFDDDEDDDVGDDVELMTNATMTPAGRGGELDDDDDDYDEDEEINVVDDVGTPRRRVRPKPLHPGSRRSADVAAGDVKADQLDAPGEDDAPPIITGVVDDVDADEQEEEEDEEPLNSEDDVSDDEPEVLFESDNVVVCQYDKIHRSRNRWRFHLKDGIMAINGRDHVFQKALGEAEW